MAKKAAVKPPPSALDVAVSFGNVSIGDEAASVGISVERARLSIDRADETLCGRRLTGRIEARDAHPDQGHFEFSDGIIAAVEGVFDVASIRVSTKKISATLSFAISAIDIGALCKFAKRGGKLIVAEVADLPHSDSQGNGDGKEE